MLYIIKIKNQSKFTLLDIKNLHASIGEKEILRGINLTVNAGEIHAVMGPNGSGKSTLAQVLAGHPGYEVTAGEVLYDGRNLLEMDPEVRAQEGIFLAFQYPIEIPGVLPETPDEKRRYLAAEQRRKRRLEERAAEEKR